jgi:hypothetical protein
MRDRKASGWRVVCGGREGEGEGDREIEEGEEVV